MMKLLTTLLAGLLIAGTAIHGAETRPWRIYFTRPDNRYLNTTRGPESALVKLINRTKHTLDGAFYDISSRPVTSALVAAKKRGVTIRLVTESDNMHRKSITRLMKAGIPVRGDNRAGLMHNKFAILDGKVIWTGSYNITRNGTWKNNNHALAVISPGLAAIYQAEFDEMFTQGIFGNRNEINPFHVLSKKYYIKLGDMHINCYFSPEDNVESIIIKRIRKARKSIRFMAFSFTSDAIAEAMIQKHKQGISVKGIFERRGSTTKYSEYIKMKVEGLKVKKDRNRYLMHHKVIIIDDETVITGSYNFSRNANKNNDENLLIITNKILARAFTREFNRLYH